MRVRELLLGAVFGCFVAVPVASAQVLEVSESSDVADVDEVDSDASAVRDDETGAAEEDVEGKELDESRGDPPPPPDPSDSSASLTATTAACVLGEHAGIADADARTAAAIVCGELATRQPRPGRRYRVGLGKLGKVVILSLSEELEDGSTARHRQVTLSGIEEVPVGAPRVVAALLDDTTVEETETVDNLVGQDTRPAKKREGSSVFGLGVIGLLADVGRVESSVGLDLALVYEAPRVAIGFDVRFAAITDGEGVGMFATGPFGRYFLAKKDIAPYVGAGMGPMFVHVDKPDFEGEDWGLAFWAEAGVELMRTHKSQLVVGGRLDVPMFTVSDGDRSAHALPFELMAAIHFD